MLFLSYCEGGYSVDVDIKYKPMPVSKNKQYWCEIVYYYGTNAFTCLCGSEAVPLLLSPHRAQRWVRVVPV